jgi:hypothetical protein
MIFHHENLRHSSAQVVYSAPMDIRRKRPVMEVRKNKATMLRKQRLGSRGNMALYGFITSYSQL